MKFGPVPLDQAEGAILAHSLAAGTTRLKKGKRLTAADCALLSGLGHRSVLVARLGANDIPEDAAAEQVARALVADAAALGMTVSAPFTGRVNLHAVEAGVFTFDPAAVHRLNAIDPAITLATLPPFSRVAARQMLATVKIIPYAAPAAAVRRCVECAPAVAPRVAPIQRRRARLVLTRTPGFKPTLLQKGERAVRDRLNALGITLATVEIVPHEIEPLARALGPDDADIVLVLTASATSDRNDTGPAALLAAGGRLQRFGIPVDPGNLLYLGELGSVPVVGLPGCARSPALNGADWVLERIACGVPVQDEDLVAMGVGGLLKEIPTRPQPRAAPLPSGRPVVHALVLAAGASSRMRGRDKLLEDVDGRPLLHRILQGVQGGGFDSVSVTLPPEPGARLRIARKLDVPVVTVADADEGMAASIRAGMAAVPPATDAVMIVLADMPEIEAADLARIIAAFDAEEGREIVRAVTEDGTPGHPILFGRRFFDSLSRLRGDKGARDVIRDAGEFVVEIVTSGRSATIDLDTPEAWEAWRSARQGSS